MSPQHAYMTDRAHPPSVLDHLLAHGFELMAAAWAFLGGIAAVWASLTDAPTVSPTLDVLPDWAAWLVGGLLIAGGGLMGWGLLSDDDDLAVGWARERAGLVFFSAGWLAYGLTVAVLAPHAVLSWSLSIFFTTAAMLRIWAIVLTERRTKRAMGIVRTRTRGGRNRGYWKGTSIS